MLLKKIAYNRFIAAGIAALSVFSIAACKTEADMGGSTTAPETAKATAAQDALATAETTEITEAPTEEPTPTPEPTATPVPWIVDPAGHVPKDVEIVCKQERDMEYTDCIVKKNDTYYAQTWENGELYREIPVPEEILDDAQYVETCAYNAKYDVVEVSHTDGTYSIYWKTAKGTFLKRGILGASFISYRTLLLEHNVLIRLDYEWDSYYLEYTFPSEYDLVYDDDIEYWRDKNSGEIIGLPSWESKEIHF